MNDVTNAPATRRSEREAIAGKTHGSVSETVSRWASTLWYEDIPDEVLAIARLCLVDSLGIQWAAQALDTTKAVREMVMAWGGKPQARVPGCDEALPIPSAALLGGVAAHGNDFDDTHLGTMVHGTAVILPAALSAAQAAGASGKEFLVALIAGYETAFRIGLVNPLAFHRAGFHTTSVVAVFGAAMAAGVASRLDSAALTNALGIAGSQAAGMLQPLIEGADSKLFNCGWAA